MQRLTTQHLSSHTHIIFRQTPALSYKTAATLFVAAACLGRTRELRSTALPTNNLTPAAGGGPVRAGCVLLRSEHTVVLRSL